MKDKGTISCMKLPAHGAVGSGFESLLHKTDFFKKVYVYSYRQLAIWIKATGHLICFYWLLRHFVRTLRTIPILPVKFGRMIQTVVIIWTKDISVSISMNQIGILIHGFQILLGRSP